MSTEGQGSAAGVAYREVKDSRGRVYRVGETDRDLLGYPRQLMVWLPWAAMIAISVFEYAYGSAEDTLHTAHHWSHSNTFWILSIWVFFQAGVSFPVGWLREKEKLAPRNAMWIGSALCLIGFLSLSHLQNVWLAIIGFGVIGGLGSGFVYSTCVNMVGKWYPEKRGGVTGFVNGGFAYGAVPFVFIFNYWFDTSDYQRVLDLIGVYVLVVVAVCAYFFKDPPKNWWPTHVDPLRAQRDRSNVSITKNPPAVKQFTPLEAIRTGMLPMMWIGMVITAGVSIFGISFQVDYAKDVGFGPLVAASSAGIMDVLNGVGRFFVGWISDRLGRKVTLIGVIIILGLAQFGVLWAGTIRSEWLFLAFAFVSGFGGGAFYPLFASLVPDYFGENNNATNYGLVYSGKLVSGLFGSGMGSMAIDAWGYDGAYTLAGCISLVAAVVCLGLRQPGRQRPRKITPNPQPISREAV